MTSPPVTYAADGRVGITLNRPDKLNADQPRAQAGAGRALPSSGSITRVAASYSFDCREPKHVHVRRERMVCKFWLTPVALAANYDFSARELNVIRSYIEEYLLRFLEAWDEHCGS